MTNRFHVPSTAGCLCLALGLAATAAAQQAPVKPPPVKLPPAQAATTPATVAPAGTIPARPEKIEFPPLSYEPPDAARFRRTLPDGTVVYLAPSHELPLVTISITFKGGSALDPADIPGLAAMTARMIREGGPEKMEPAAFDETLDFLATEISVADTKRLDTAKARSLEALKQRNDDASSIIGREWKRLVYGADHFEASEPTDKSLAAISRERLAAMHKRICHPGNAIVAVSGDFDEAEMLARLTKAFTGWERGPVAEDPAAPTAVLEPGLYHVPKKIPQGKVAIGGRSIRRDDPDMLALLLLNEILGDGGFTKNATVALATKIVLDEIRKIRTEPVTADELETAKRSLIETFPRQFESKPQMLRVFVNDEWTKRPADHWKTFRARIDALTAADLLRVAQKHLDPEKMAILVVGDWDEIAAGDLGKRASMTEFFGGKVRQLPLRDPLTLEPLPADPVPATGTKP